MRSTPQFITANLFMRHLKIEKPTRLHASSPD
jgi:hypothetical protein